MSIKPYLPTGKEVIREGLIVLAGVLIAAAILSRFPKLQAFVQNNSVTVKNAHGETII